MMIFNSFTVANDYNFRAQRPKGRRVSLPTNRTFEGICLALLPSSLNFFKRCFEFFLYLKLFFKKTIKFNFKLIYEHVTQDLICIWKQKTFSPVSSINSSQTVKALPVTTSKPNFVTFFVYFGNILFDYLWNFFVCYGIKPGSHFARNLRTFGVACSEELEVNQWILNNYSLKSRWIVAEYLPRHFVAR